MNLNMILQNEYYMMLFKLSILILIYVLLRIILNQVVQKIVKNTKTNIDEKIFYVAKRPIFICFILYGIYFIISDLSILAENLHFIWNILFVLIIIIVAYYLNKIFNIILLSLLKLNKKYENTPMIIIKVVNIIIYLIFIIIILDYFGIAISPIITTLGIGGLSIGLALKETFESLIAGFYIIFEKPFKIGDFITLDSGISGKVDNIGWSTTKLTTFGNQVIYVPNSKFKTSIITNLSRPAPMKNAVVTGGVTYDSDLEKVEKILNKIGEKLQKTSEQIDPNSTVLARFSEFEDSAIGFRIVLKAKSYIDSFKLKHDLLKEIKKEFDKQKIEFAFPTRTNYNINLKK